MNRVVTRKAVSKACDACRRRKIKCNGRQPCPGCTSAQLSCTFHVPQRRGGNTGAKATVLNELRSNQQERSASERYTTASQPSPPSCASSTSISLEGGVDDVTIHACIDAYLNQIHPVVPIVTADILEEEAGQATNSLASRQFLTSFCAYVVTFGKVLDETFFISSSTSRDDLGQRLLDAALRIHYPETVSLPNRLSPYISFFLYGAYTGLGKYRQGWFYLREATTLFLMQGGSEGWYDPKAYRCLFWVLVVSERSHGIRRNRPITILINELSPTLNDPSERGLRYLASIFRPLDDIFFAVWNGSRQDCNKEWLLGLEQDMRTALPPILDVSNEEITNLRISQLWLQIKLWELFPRFGFLSSDSVHECFTFKYPISIAKDLTILAMKLPIGSFQIHGVGMTEKIFDIACAVADVIPFVTIATSHFELDPTDYLTHITYLLSRLPGGSSKLVPLLLVKVKELLPEFVNRLCATVDIPVASFDDPMSPDTKFMYEEEVGRGLYMDLRRVEESLGK